jgi:large subunit ribosomal protein L6
MIMVEKEIEIPEGVNLEVEGKKIIVSGEKGQLERIFKYFHPIKIEIKGNKLVVSSKSDKRKVKAMIGTIVSHTKNMIKGVKKGYTYKMKVIYSHFPVTVKVEGNQVKINNFIGEKKPRVARIMGDTRVEVKGQEIFINGINKESVGQTMGNIEQSCRITKYDRRIFQDGVYFVGEEDG